MGYKQINFRQQTGAALIIMAVLLSLSLITIFFTFMQPFAVKQQRAAHTRVVLAQAKQALLAYASQPLIRPNCGMNCPRPGDLPCPDNNNDGYAESSCTSSTARLGRLPWKTLGLGDVRDASGERLWYAVADNYKNNPRILPLNADSVGSISLKNAQGQLLRPNQGVVAVIIAPMSALTRADGLVQQRDTAQANLPKHYLDINKEISQQEDNADFLDGSDNGFVVAKLGEQFNDVVLPIASVEMQATMQASVLREVSHYLREKLCLTKKVGQICTPQNLPNPALVTDTTCLGSQGIVANGCLSATTSSLGRLPVDSNKHWPQADVSELLDGDAKHHWFQQNGWREHVFYGQQADSVTIVAGGVAMAGQQRVNKAQQTQLDNYIEKSTTERLQGKVRSVNETKTNDQWIIIKKP